MQTLANWQRKANQGKLKGTKQYDPELVSALEEIKRLKRELKTAQEEREILNEEGWSEALLRPDARRELCSSGATAYFARNGQ